MLGVSLMDWIANHIIRQRSGISDAVMRINHLKLNVTRQECPIRGVDKKFCWIDTKRGTEIESGHQLDERTTYSEW